MATSTSTPRGLDKGTSPSRTATLYRVAYRRTNREANRGYTYKVFKSEAAARGFMHKLQHPSDDVPEQFKALAPLAELYLHFGVVQWSVLADETAAPNLVESAPMRKPTEQELLDEAKQRRPGATMDQLLDEVQSIVSEGWEVLA